MMLTVLLLPLLYIVSEDPTRQFDFWIGDWDHQTKTRPNPNVETWTSSVSTNHVESILGGAVIQENFQGEGLTGKSWTVFDAKRGIWRQTWVDDQGGYIPLEGKMEGKSMILYVKPVPEGVPPHRMVFHEIARDSFQWDWEVRKKDGTWASVFSCAYRRKNSSTSKSGTSENNARNTRH